MNKIEEIIEAFFQKVPSDIKSVQLARFVVAGGLTASLDFFLYWIFVSVMDWHYILSVTISFIIASSLNYLISIYWVFFNGKYKNQMLEYLIFIIFTFLGLLLNYLILFVGVDFLKLNSLVVRLGAIILVTVFNFLTKKFIVFKN